jgi:antitoxin MazE
VWEGGGRETSLYPDWAKKYIINYWVDIAPTCNYNVPTHKGGGTMRASIIKIGNSQGLRIPKPILEQTGIRDDVEIELEKNQIIIRPVQNAREGWDKAFKKMAKNDDDKLVIDDGEITNTWDEEEWQW